jgi:hypothetical protein
VHIHFCMRIEGNVVKGLRWQGEMQKRADAARLFWLADGCKEKQVFFATRYGDGWSSKRMGLLLRRERAF